MKRINIFYWVSTGLFAAFMIFSSVSNVIMDPQAVDFIGGGLGYPEYIIPFLGVAKILGSLVILIPGLNKLKEWAYAGLFFDLAGALFSIYSVHGFQADSLVMLLPISLLFASYWLWGMRQKNQNG